MNPYSAFVRAYVQQVDSGRSLPHGGFPPCRRPDLKAEAPKALFFAPHPDDECIVGALALRLLREAGVAVTDVAITLGSRKDRQLERLEELKGACDFLGFRLVQTAARGLDGIKPDSRQAGIPAWTEAVGIIAGIIEKENPRIVFFPHQEDANGTHIGTSLLLHDALEKLGAKVDCLVFETEFWRPMQCPNLMVECSETDLADLIAAITFHRGEIARNPYHLTLPAWMQDNVRRGSEMVGGQGAESPDMHFAALYRVRRRRAGRFEEVFKGGKIITCRESLKDVLAGWLSA